MIGVLVFAFLINQCSANLLSTHFHENQLTESSLREAVLKGFNKAKKWHPNAKLVVAVSKDDEEKYKGIKGMNGKRLDWGEGYHFTLLKDNGKLFLSITGVDDKNRVTKIYYNPMDGKYWGREVNNHPTER
ncbi:hypothetical protein [Marininema halotolerans]|uniref:Uncharacterized protein n=1 Tax=Marininema halotolerans TaxID=1155944 RepID=A0A1I6R3F6_9BACL|nr:hypothetical protein [Marininema halotolerans]SFS59262.1 hypothetical protein SAMN05444972_10484 [Marininema halotolerans]